MKFHYWQYFISLEADLAKTARYIEPARKNMKCYSIEFARLILAAGSEIDVLCKVLCDRFNLSVSPNNMDGYRKAIISRFPGFTNLEIQIPRYGLARLPWQDWDDGKNPLWWRTYNNIKHERHRYFEEANLQNALDSVSGLFVIISYLYEKELRARTARPWPKLLTLDQSLSSFISTSTKPGYILPDFKNVQK